MLKVNRIGLKGLLLIAGVALTLAACAPAAQAPAAAPAPAAPGAPKAPAPAGAPAPAAAPQPVAPAPAAAPAPAPAPAKSKGPAGTITIAVTDMGQEAWTVRLNSFDDMVVRPIGDVLYGLNRKDNDTFDPSVGLLDSWKMDVKGDDVVTTMVLKRGIPWHNNEGVVTTQDVKFTEGHLLVGGTISGITQRIAAFNKDVKNIEIVDDITMRYHSKLPWVFADYRKLWVQGSLMPKAYTERVGEAGYTKQPINTGPFKMIEHISDTRVTLEAVPNHWRKTPEYQKLVILKVPEGSTRLAMLLTGQIAISDITFQQASLVEKNAKTRVIKQPGSALSYFVGGMINKFTWEGLSDGKLTNVPSPYDPKIPWVGNDFLAPDKVKVRLAMDLAIDRQAIIDQLYLGYATPIVTFQSWGFGARTPGALWYNRWPVRAYDPQKAKQLLAEAGYPNGFNMNAFVSELSSNPVNGKVMVAIANFWEKNLNIKVNLTYAQYSPTVRQNFLTRTFGDHAFTYPSGSAAAPQLPQKPGTTLWCSWCSLAYFEHPVMDELIRSSEGVLDLDKSLAISTKMGDFIYNNLMANGVAEGQLLWGIHKDYVKEWNKNQFSASLTDIEYVVKP